MLELKIGFKTQLSNYQLTYFQLIKNEFKII
jgi:hypothetical protein